MTATEAASATSSNSLLQSYLTQQSANQAAAAAATASGSSTSGLAQATSASQIGSNFNTFITILTAQLKNQDPTNATDPNQFTQELVQFAGVEQQLNTNNDLQTLINLQKTSSGTTADLGYIGQYVEAPTTSQISLQSGSAELGYTLGSAATNVTVTVQNSSGNTVATLSGSTNTGQNYLTWNGQDQSGNQLADGAYTFTLVATNADGTTQTPTATTAIGLVTGVTSNTDGTTNLSLGSLSILTSAVDGVYTAATKPAGTTTSS